MYNQHGVGTPPQQQPQNPASTQIPLNPQGQPIAPQGMPQNYGLQQPPQPTQQPPQQFNPSRLTVSGDEILDGAGIPPELRGRKASEVMRIYQALADDFITRRRQQQPQAQQPQQSQQPQGQQPRNQQGQFQQQPPQQTQGSFWQNPDENLTNIVRQVVQEAVHPFQQQNLAQGAQSARERARQSIPDFQDLEPDIMEVIKGSSPEALASPEYWEHAADLARGRRFRRQQTQPQQQPQQQPQTSVFGPNAVPATQPMPQPVMPQQQVPTGAPMNGYPHQVPGAMPQAQRPPTYSFFTEAPTAPSPYHNTHSASLSQAQQEVARLAGVSPEQYQAWSQIQGQGVR